MKVSMRWIWTRLVEGSAERILHQEIVEGGAILNVWIRASMMLPPAR